MSEKRFVLKFDSQENEYFIRDNFEEEEELGSYTLKWGVRKLNEQQATIEEYEDFCLNLCKFLIQKDLVDEYREKYGKEYKIITKWKGCGR